MSNQRLKTRLFPLVVAMLLAVLAVIFSGCSVSESGQTSQSAPASTPELSSTIPSSSNTESSSPFEQFKAELDALNYIYTETAMASDLVGAKQGVKYEFESGGKIEIYLFEENSESLKKATQNKAITLEGFGDFAAEINGNLAAIIDGINDPQPIIEAFNKIIVK